MSSLKQSFNDNQGQVSKAQGGDVIQSANNSTTTATNKANEVAHSTVQQAQQNKEEAVGFLQQTGEQVINMAQGAMDTVKQTLGMDK